MEKHELSKIDFEIIITLRLRQTERRSGPHVRSIIRRGWIPLCLCPRFCRSFSWR